MLEMQELCNNFKSLNVNGIKLYFSYNTCVAFKTDCALYCTKNIWGVTTGKHLNMICKNHKDRLSNVNFNAILGQVLETINIRIIA